MRWLAKLAVLLVLACPARGQDAAPATPDIHTQDPVGPTLLQSSGEQDNFSNARLRRLEKSVNEFRSGRPAINGIPNFLGGIYLGGALCTSCGGGGGSSAWSSLTGFPTGCTLPNLVRVVGTTLTCTQPSDVTGNAATVTTNANLSGGVTSVGNVATVVTNANLTGPVTSVGNATAITAGAVGAAEIASTAVGAGAYALAGITVDSDGRLTAAASGNTAPSSFTFNAGMLVSSAATLSAGATIYAAYTATADGVVGGTITAGNYVQSNFIDVVVFSTNINCSNAISSITFNNVSTFSGKYEFYLDLYGVSATTGTISLVFDSQRAGSRYQWRNQNTSNNGIFNSNADDKCIFTSDSSTRFPLESNAYFHFRGSINIDRRDNSVVELEYSGVQKQSSNGSGTVDGLYGGCTYDGPGSTVSPKTITIQELATTIGQPTFCGDILIRQFGR